MGLPGDIHDGDVIGFAERVLAILDPGRGRKATTYKLAVLLGLMDAALERTTEDEGRAPDMITTAELADKVLEIYWIQTLPYVLPDGTTHPILRQGGATVEQAEIVSAIARFRQLHAPDPSTSLARARATAPVDFARLRRSIEWKLIEMPLPRLQRIGGEHDPFIYQIGWDESIRQRVVTEYQRGGGGSFDNRLLLRPRVGEYLVRLAGLLRPIIHRRWAAMVAQMNDLADAKLEEHLFGLERISTEPIRNGLIEIQEGRCFYCEDRLRGSLQVDHFIPWARHPDNGIANLVATHEACNQSKRDRLAAAEHVRRWRMRFDRGATADALSALARSAMWQHEPARTLSVARAIYLRLPTGARLWVRGDVLAPYDPPAIAKALAIVS